MKGAVFSTFALFLVVLFGIKGAEFKIRVLSHQKGSLQRVSPRFLVTHGSDDHDVNLEPSDETSKVEDVKSDETQVENEEEAKPYVTFPQGDQEGNEANDAAAPNYESQENGNDANERHGGKEAAESNPVHDIKRDEAMHEMNSEAEAMRQNAEEESEEIKREAKQVKENSAVDQETNTRQVVPKPSGDIVINNKTHVQASSNKASDEAKDILQAVRTATQSLYQRAQHKNLPVPDLGALETPMDIYRALNSLENIIEGYRNAQLESPNPIFNRSYENVQEEQQEKQPERGTPQVQEEKPAQEASKTAEESAEVPNFLQLKQDDNDGGDEDEMYDQGLDDASEYGDDEDLDDSFIAAGGARDEAGEEGAVDGTRESENANGGKTNLLANKHKATDILRDTIVDLIKALDSVLTNTTGIANIIVARGSGNYNHVAATAKANHGL